MGGIYSTIRRMFNAQEDSEHQHDGSHEDDESVAALLSYLIRSGHVRLITTEPTQGLSDSDDDDRESVTAWPYNDRRPDSSNTTSAPDLSSLENNDVKRSVEISSGEHCSNHHRVARPNLLTSLSEREFGLRKSYHFGSSEKCFIMRGFLPNKMRTAARVESKMFCGQYAADGNLFVSACQDHRLRIYNTACGHFELSRTVEARDVGWSILDVAVSPDGRHIAYSSWSDFIHQCSISEDNIDSHQAFGLSPADHRFCVFSLKFSNDGREIIAGASNKCLYVYDRVADARVLKAEVHDDDVNAVTFADDSSQIFYSGSDDGLCKVWDRRTLSEANPRAVGCLVGHIDGLTFIDSKGDARYLITNSKDQTIKLWDIRKFSSSSAIEESRKIVSEQNWDYRWQDVPRNGINAMKRRGLHGDSSVMTYRGHLVLHTLIRCYFSPMFTTGQRFIYTGCGSGKIHIYDLLTGEIVSTLSGHRACVRDVAWHPSLPEICSSSWDGRLGWWTFSGKFREGSPEDGRSTSRSKLQERYQETQEALRRSATTHRRNNVPATRF